MLCCSILPQRVILNTTTTTRTTQNTNCSDITVPRASRHAGNYYYIEETCEKISRQTPILLGGFVFFYPSLSAVAAASARPNRVNARVSTAGAWGFSAAVDERESRVGGGNTARSQIGHAKRVSKIILDACRYRCCCVKKYKIYNTSYNRKRSNGVRGNPSAVFYDFFFFYDAEIILHSSKPGELTTLLLLLLNSSSQNNREKTKTRTFIVFAKYVIRLTIRKISTITVTSTRRRDISIRAVLLFSRFLKKINFSNFHSSFA